MNTRQPPPPMGLLHIPQRPVLVGLVPNVAAHGTGPNASCISDPFHGMTVEELFKDVFPRRPQGHQNGLPFGEGFVEVGGMVAGARAREGGVGWWMGE